MKKILLVGALAFSSLFAVAQEGLQGVWFAGGSVTLSNDKDKTDTRVKELKTDAYKIMPLVGKFITPSVAIGGALGYSHGKEESVKSLEGDKFGIKDIKSTSFTVMPLVRKYWNIAGGLYFYGQVALPVEFGNTKDDGAKTNTFGVHAQLSPGFDYIVNSWITVEASFLLMNAGYSSEKPKGGETNSSWGLSGNSIHASDFGDLTVGVKFLF